MSKFVEMLEKTHDSTPPPLGFGAAAKQEDRNPPIVLIGQATPEDISGNASIADAKVDAILLSLTSSESKSVDGVSDSLKDKLWGIRVGAISEEQATSFKEKGCDFIVFDAESTSASVLNDEDLGKIIALPPDLEEDMGQAIHGLSVDCVLYSPIESILPLTVQGLIEIEMVRGLVGKQFVMAAPSDLGKSDLEALKNAHISGLIVNLSATDDISSTKDAIMDLPQHKADRSGDRLMAQAPSAGFASLGRSNEPDEDDEDEYDEE